MILSIERLWNRFGGRVLTPRPNNATAEIERFLARNLIGGTMADAMDLAICEAALKKVAAERDRWKADTMRHLDAIDGYDGGLSDHGACVVCDALTEPGPEEDSDVA